MLHATKLLSGYYELHIACNKKTMLHMNRTGFYLRQQSCLKIKGTACGRGLVKMADLTCDTSIWSSTATLESEKRWTDSRTDLLIALLKSNPFLYNTSQKEYRNRDLRKKAMENMATQLEITGLCMSRLLTRFPDTSTIVEQEVKAKIKSLRSTYSREKRKKKKRITGTGLDEVDQQTSFRTNAFSR